MHGVHGLSPDKDCHFSMELPTHIYIYLHIYMYVYI